MIKIFTTVSLLLALSCSVLAAEEPRELQWDDLMPADFLPEEKLATLINSDLSDSDPAALAMLEEVRQLWALSPPVEALNNQKVKLPGFVVPLDGGEQSSEQFLLVPYFGACIHVPPPPSNQTVLVDFADGAKHPRKMFDTVWVIGTMKVERIEEELGTAGYRLVAERVEDY